jgi:hypothetical protein
MVILRPSQMSQVRIPNGGCKEEKLVGSLGFEPRFSRPQSERVTVTLASVLVSISALSSFLREMLYRDRIYSQHDSHQQSHAGSCARAARIRQRHGQDCINRDNAGHKIHSRFLSALAFYILMIHNSGT